MPAWIARSLAVLFCLLFLEKNATARDCDDEWCAAHCQSTLIHKCCAYYEQGQGKERSKVPTISIPDLGNLLESLEAHIVTFSACTKANVHIRAHIFDGTARYYDKAEANKCLQALAINTLASYASLVRYFVIIAPKTVHNDTRMVCDPSTYQRRGWCRLEQWARLIIGGAKGMFLYKSQDAALTHLSSELEWLNESSHVFHGDYTDPRDKHKIVDMVLGLYGHSYLHSQIQAWGCKTKRVSVRVQKDGDTFPAAFFGDLVDTMENKINRLWSDSYGETEVHPTASLRSENSNLSTKSLDNNSGDLRLDDFGISILDFKEVQDDIQKGKSVLAALGRTSTGLGMGGTLSDLEVQRELTAATSKSAVLAEEQVADDDSSTLLMIIGRETI